MGVLLRVLGLQALVAVIERASPRAGAVAAFLTVLVANLAPLYAVATGTWLAGDVLIAFWLENIAVYFWLVFQALTATRLYDKPGAVSFRSGSEVTPVTGEAARWIAVVGLTGMLGFASVLHGMFAISLAMTTGTRGTLASFLVLFAVVWSSHGVATILPWIGGGRRNDPDATPVGADSKRRLAVLHVSLIATFAFLQLTGGMKSLNAAVDLGFGDFFHGGPLPQAPTLSIVPAVVLIGTKLFVDVLGLLDPRPSGSVSARRAEADSTA